MKKAIIVILVLFSGCSFVQDIYISTMIGNELYYHDDFLELDSYEKIESYIRVHTEYDYNDDAADFKNPEETLNSGKGSCADFAILYMNIAYYGMGIKMNLITCEIGREVVDGGSVNHAAVEYNGEIRDVSGEIKVSVGYMYTFNEVF